MAYVVLILLATTAEVYTFINIFIDDSGKNVKPVLYIV